MSTKSTIASGPTFHLYHELADEDAVYLELESVHFVASYNRVVAPIPVHIWEVIRAYAGVDLSWVDYSDEDVRADVTRRVDERLLDAATAAPEAAALVHLRGIAVYGDLDTPREEQIARGIQHIEELRTHQREIRAAIEELRRLNRPPHVPHVPGAPAAQSPSHLDTDAPSSERPGGAPGMDAEAD